MLQKKFSLTIIKIVFLFLIPSLLFSEEREISVWSECYNDLCQRSISQTENHPLPALHFFIKEHNKIFDERVLPLLKEIQSLYVNLCKMQEQYLLEKTQDDLDQDLLKLMILAPEKNTYRLHQGLINFTSQRERELFLTNLTPFVHDSFLDLTLDDITTKILFEYQKAKPNIQEYIKTRYFSPLKELTYNSLFNFLEKLETSINTRLFSKGSNFLYPGPSRQLLKDLMLINHPLVQESKLYPIDGSLPKCTFLEESLTINFEDPTTIENLRLNYSTNNAFARSIEHYDLEDLHLATSQVYQIIRNLIDDDEVQIFDEFFKKLRVRLLPMIEHDLYVLQHFYLIPLKAITEKINTNSLILEMNLDAFYFDPILLSKKSDDYEFYSNTVQIRESRLEYKQYDIIAHELGHTLFMLFTLNKEDLTQTKFYQKIRTASLCLNGIYSSLEHSKELPLNQGFDFEEFYTSEDFADLVAAYYLKNTNNKTTWLCALQQSNYYDLSILNQIETDTHSSYLFRLIASTINQGENLPQSCLKNFEEENINPSVFQNCLNFLE